MDSVLGFNLFLVGSRLIEINYKQDSFPGRLHVYPKDQNNNKKLKIHNKARLKQYLLSVNSGNKAHNPRGKDTPSPHMKDMISSPLWEPCNCQCEVYSQLESTLGTL